MRRPFIAANWKMNKTLAEAGAFLDEFLPAVKAASGVDIAIAPPFTLLEAVGKRLKGTAVMLSAQDVFYEEKGAFTGEVSPGMLLDVGCVFAIIGHSERRQFFGETDQTVNKKLKAGLKAGLGVIFCIGETIEERKAWKTFEVLKRQIREGLKDIGAGSPSDIEIADTQKTVVAYEPIWAIGTGVTATTEQAGEAHEFIRRELKALYGGTSDAFRILYGGSVTPENIAGLMACPDVDGALVGGASLKPDSFAKIVGGTAPRAINGQ